MKIQLAILFTLCSKVIMQITYRKDFSEVFVLFGHTFLDNWYQSQTG